MTNSERKVLREFVAGRLSITFRQLKDNTRQKERLQYLAAGTEGTGAEQGVGQGTVTDTAAG